MTIKLANISLDPPVFLAPMAGITDLPFRNLVSTFGAGLVVSEMIASQELVQARAATQARAELGLDTQNSAVQIAGRDAYWMAECAKLCQGEGARIIDINMGCPAKKVTNGYSGSALMKTPELALSLIRAVVDAVDVPVTLKMRLGWDDDMLNAPEIARAAADAGVQMITIHGRTRCQFYKGQADWKSIKNVVEAVDIPVVANGDVVDTVSARSAMEQSRAAGVMVGRGAQGQPWQLAKIAAEIFQTPAPDIPSGKVLAEMIKAHYEASLSFYGRTLGGKTIRKHLGWYMDGISVTAEQRRRLLTAEDEAEVMTLIDSYFSTPQIGQAA